MNEEETYFKLRNRYLSVYLLATFGDWIQAWLGLGVRARARARG